MFVGKKGGRCNEEVLNKLNMGKKKKINKCLVGKRPRKTDMKALAHVLLEMLLAF